VFVTGPARSGKTLLRWMLAEHPALFASRRTDLWSRFHDRFGGLDEPRNLDRCLDAMLAHKHVAVLRPDPARLRTELARGEPTYARLFALVHEHAAEREGRRRWVDQSELAERFADEILSSYPGARVLHVLRDPRDCCAARRAQRRSPFRIEREAGRWAASARLARRHVARHPDHYAVVRYEELVSDPLATMMRVCAFLGEELVPAMVELPNARRYYDERARSGTAITARHVGEYRHTLGRHEIARVELSTHPYMTAFGYAADAGASASLTDRIRARVVGRRTWPVSPGRARRERAR
jgi:hypothetical protein